MKRKMDPRADIVVNDYYSWRCQSVDVDQNSGLIHTAEYRLFYKGGNRSHLESGSIQEHLRCVQFLLNLKCFKEVSVDIEYKRKATIYISASVFFSNGYQVQTIER